MTLAPPVKPSLFFAVLFALSCSSARPVPVSSLRGASSESPDADAGTQARPGRPQVLVAPTSAEMTAIRPLLARGPVFIVRNADGGADARITLITRARVPPARVHAVITTPGDYTTFMPILRSVDVISSHAGRMAFRFHVAAPLFDVTALSALHDISERRVDVAITQAETGPGASRWDLTPDGDDASIVSLTTWGDPSQGHWLLRQVARRTPSAIAGMNISTDTVLALGAVRRAEILAGQQLPMRPAEGSAPPGDLAPPERGPWLELARDATVLSMGLTPEGAVTQVTVAAYTSADRDVVLERLRNVAGYPSVWGSIKEVHVLSGGDGGVGESVRYSVVIETPLTHIEGEQTVRSEGDTVWQDGVAGDLAGSSHRWDVLRAPDGGSWVLLTGGSDTNRAGWVTRALMSRDSWLMAGFAGSWKIVWLRNLLRGL